MKLMNSYASLPKHFYAEVQTASAPSPTLLAWNADLAAHLGIDKLESDPQALLDIVSGSAILPGSATIALAYAGHQFGNFVPQLGDGRAALIGEVMSPVNGNRYDIQLKGSGATPFSRNGDGKSSLGPVIREYLLSEAMHRLGVPTTRALAAVSTGEDVMRNRIEPGGVLTRVATSHLRVGTFQYFATREDHDALATLANYAIERHYPDAADAEEPLLAFFEQVITAQAKLVAHWMSIGFIHGVMNTDNCAISGETLDYGPCAFMDNFDIDKVFSSIDRHGRYAYGQQASMAHWNLTRLAECLMMVKGEQDDYVERLEQFHPQFETHFFNIMSKKLGLAEEQPENSELVTGWLQHLQSNRLDYTHSFTQLASRIEQPDSLEFGDFESRWRQRIEAQAGGRAAAAQLMAAANPVVIPRNHQIERAIQAAFENDFSVFEELQKVLAQPFNVPSELAHYAEPPMPHEEVEMTFCGT